MPNTMQKDLLRPTMEELMYKHTMYPSGHIYNEAAFRASGAVDFIMFRTAQLGLYLRLTTLVSNQA